MNQATKKMPVLLQTETGTQASHYFSNKSPAAEAQRQRIITALRAGPKTSYELGGAQ